MVGLVVTHANANARSRAGDGWRVEARGPPLGRPEKIYACKASYLYPFCIHLSSYPFPLMYWDLAQHRTLLRSLLHASQNLICLWQLQPLFSPRLHPSPESWLHPCTRHTCTHILCTHSTMACYKHACMHVCTCMYTYVFITRL